MTPPATGADARGFVAAPRVARTRGELSEALLELRGDARKGVRGNVPAEKPATATPSVALVPTMGALHEGHLSLIRRARELSDHVVVSVFVNPLQFAPGEDFERYPRTFGADLEACRAEGVALVFAPPHDVIYPEDPVVRVNPGTMGERFEGASRPGHFDGVLTVVLKLFQLVGPDVAVFGQKDAQQLALVRRMARDLNVPVRVAAGETVRDRDGLAISSRNAYLSAAERVTALALVRGMRAGRAAGRWGAEACRRAALDVLDSQAGLDLDYVALVDPETFADVPDGYSGEAILAVAARVGGTHLIDNAVVTVAATSPDASAHTTGDLPAKTRKD